MYETIKILLVISFFSVFSRSQEVYNNCTNALQLCPNQTVNVNNIDANATFCPSCEDDFNFCFSGENSVWFQFQTNAIGGDVNINLSNLNFQNLTGQGNALQAVVLSAAIPCDASTYAVVSNCEANITGGFNLIAAGLTPLTTYYVVVNGAMGASSNAECIFDIAVNGAGIEENNTSIVISASSTDLCKGEQVTLTANLLNCSNQQAINWFVNGLQIGSTTSTTFVTSALSNGDVVTANVTCFNPCNQTFTSNAIPFTVTDFLVDAGPDFEIDAGESVQLQGTTTESIIEWQPAIFMSNPFVINPVVSPPTDIEYYLTVSNGTCTIQDICKIKVKEAITIPNTFSPNNDGSNDTWEILGIEKYPNCLVQVFNRWGQEVFKTTGYSLNKRWDGTNKGKPLASSSYFYVIDLRVDEFTEPFKGYVSIIR